MTAAPNRAPAWDVGLRDHLITTGRAPAIYADEVVDLIRHARHELYERIVAIASTGSTDWVRSMVLGNGAELIKGDLDDLIDTVKAMEGASGRPIISTPVHLSVDTLSRSNRHG